LPLLCAGRALPPPPDKGDGRRETKERRVGTAFRPARVRRGAGNDIAGNGGREAGAAGRGGANSTAAIDSGLICAGTLRALPTQMDIGEKIADFLFAARRKRSKSDAIWSQNASDRWRLP
jgi:hypothetical protein